MSKQSEGDQYNGTSTSYEFSYEMAPVSNRERIDSAVSNKRGLTAKIRQKLTTVSNPKPTSPQPLVQPSSSFSHLSAQNQELVLRAVEAIKKEDSENIIETLDSSRQLLRSSFEEFKQEQESFRKQLETVIKYKEAAIQRPKENMIPLSVVLRQKHDVEGLSDLRPNSSMNPTYHAYFEALLVSNNHQHPTDRAAVAKYIRRRERQKRAEDNKINHTISPDALEQRAAELMQNKEGIDMKLEYERQRQNELLRSRMNEKKIKNNNLLQANEIIGQASEAELLRQRAEQAQREKVEARLSALRQQQNRSPTNLIHVQAHADQDQEDPVEELNEHEKEASKRVIALLEQQSGYGSRPGTATGTNYNISRANIEI